MDTFTLVIQFLVLGGALLTALLSVTALKDSARGLPEGEYWFLLLSSAAGAALLPASRDLATLVVALEVASLPAFALVGLRHGDRKSSEAALKFFLSSVTATAVTLMGISFLYATTGTLYLTEIADRVQHVDSQFHTLAQVGVVLTLIGFAFKTAAVPFHFWVPDTYVGAPCRSRPTSRSSARRSASPASSWSPSSPCPRTPTSGAPPSPPWPRSP